MLKGHNQYFKGYIIDRTEEIGQEILVNNQRYRELNTEISEVQQALADNLSPQLQPLLGRYDNAEAEQDSVIIEIMYQQGLIDGLKLAKLASKIMG
jgi:hypothetical protein